MIYEMFGIIEDFNITSTTSNRILLKIDTNIQGRKVIAKGLFLFDAQTSDTV